MQVYKNFAICLLLILKVSGKSQSENHAPDPQDHKPHGYSFSYGVNDHHTGDKKEQWEKKEGNVVNGSYSLVEADGSIRTVEYTADDKNGFNAVVKHSSPAYGKVHKDDELNHAKVQLDQIDFNPKSADYVSSEQPTKTKSVKDVESVKIENTISEDQYDVKPVFEKWSDVVAEPLTSQPMYDQELLYGTQYKNIYSSTALKDDSPKKQQNPNSDKLSSFPTHLSLFEPNQEVIDPKKNDFQSLYQFRYGDGQKSQEYQNNYFQPDANTKYISDFENQYKSTSKTPSYTVSFLQDLSSFEPNPKVIPINLNKINRPDQQQHFYPMYRYGKTQKSDYSNFQSVTSSPSKLSETAHTFPYDFVTIPDLKNYDGSVKAQYPINKNNHDQDEYVNNLLSLIMSNKQLESHQQINVQKSKFTRLHPKSNNREFMKYTKIVKYLED